MKALTETDKKFVPGTVEERTYLFRDCLEDPFRIYGLILPNEEDPFFTRMPRKVAETVSKDVLQLCPCTAGGRIRFQTDSATVAIRVKIHSHFKGDHFPLTGTAGVDLYADGAYRGTFRPTLKLEDSYEGWVDLRGKQMREILLHMPLYAGVISLEIGVEPGSELLPGGEYKYQTPVVYYGSSITQGGCASRPGNSYQNNISRRYDCDFINLGFSGSAKAEETMIDYLISLPMSIFVMDYDHNAPTPEYLEETHYKMYRRFRDARPDVPIVMASMPKVTATVNSVRRRAVILDTIAKAKAAGDENVYFVDGKEMMAMFGDDGGLVDDCHPNDLGFLCMARAFGEVIGKLLETR